MSSRLRAATSRPVGDGVTAPKGLPQSRFRPELHGLRGLAILLVVLFHVLGDGRVSGGIDVFLAISGFLYTASLLRRAVLGRPPGSRSFDLAGYLANLARRLLPPALLVLGVVAAVGTWMLPRSDQPQLIRELLATLLYRENWELIDSQLSYGAAGPGASPLQHFWSLSVQGQFYLLWVVVVVGAVWIARALKCSPVVVTTVVVALLTVFSFVYALHEHERNQAVAYFHTGARLWELALAGFFALVLGLLGVRSEFPRGVRLVLGWLGVVMLVSSGFLLDGAALFPGPAAMWPVGGLLLVLLAGTTGMRFSADRLLTARPFAWLGDIAYPLYLWHWPLLVFVLRWQGAERAGLLTSAAVIAASLVLAWVTYRALEQPLTRSALRGTRQRLIVLVAGVLVVACGAAALSLWQARLEATREAELAAAAIPSTDHPGAAALEPGADAVPEVDPLPAPEVAVDDLPVTYDGACVQSQDDTPEASEVLVCEDAISDPTRTLLIAGGSHAHMWQPAFEVLAEQYGWSVQVMDKSGCQLTANVGQYSEDTDQPVLDSCQAWNVNALPEIIERAPDAVVTIGTTTAADRERYSLGFQDVWAELAEHDIPVIAIRDTARMPDHVPRCLEAGGDSESCGQARDAVLGPVYPLLEDPDLPDSVVPVDLTEYLCTDQWCPTIIGNVVVYRDHSHISATYARTLAPYLDEQLREGAAWLYE